MVRLGLEPRVELDFQTQWVLMMDVTKGDHDRSRGYNDSDGVILLHD